MCSLVGDMGGTHARFGLVSPGSSRPERVRVFDCGDYPGPEQAIASYLRQTGQARPSEACLAVAAPVTGAQVAMTNNHWHFDARALERNLGFQRCRLINDYTAMALGVLQVPEAQRVSLGGGRPAPDRPILVLGPGTGLGMSALVPAGQHWWPLATEGGHVDFAPADELETQVARRLAQRYGRVSVERVLSGQGLVDVYRALSELAGQPAWLESPEQVSAAAIARTDEQAVATLSRFCNALGRVAGNAVLTLGAYGGVYLCGGILPAILDFFLASGFRAAFEQKGRMRPLLEATPVQVVLDGQTGLYGAAVALDHPGVSK